MSAPAGTAWSTRLLAEFLEVFEVLDRDRLVQVAANRVAAAFDADVVALVGDGYVEHSLGALRELLSDGLLGRMVPEDGGVVELEALGEVQFLAVDVVASPQHHRLLVLRAARRFEVDEEVLLRSMGRALGLAMTAASSLEAERDLRAQSEAHAQENRMLVAELGERQMMSDRLQQIQRSISQRVSLQQILEAIAAGASELLRADAVGLRVQGLDNGERLSALVGFGPVTAEIFEAGGFDEGFSGRAFMENRLVAAEHFQHDPMRILGDLPCHLQAVMAVPVHRNGVPVGSLSVGSAEPSRCFTATDCEILEALAEHASLAVNDDGVVRRLRRALDGATFEAQRDPLTGLLNRRSAIAALEDLLVHVSEDHPVHAMFIDIDNFKLVNDVFGHAFGDRVLIAVAERLRNAVRGDDMVARLSGDEFVVVASDMAGRDTARWAERLTARIAEPMLIDGREVRLSASVGIATTTEVLAGEALIVDADMALYRTKQRGRGRVVHFNRRMRQEMFRRTELEHQLRSAVAASEFVVHYQPMVELDGASVCGLEALVRWQHPERGLLAPPEFLDVAEETGVISEIDRFVLFETCRKLAEWSEINPDLTASVNLSARQFADRQLFELVQEALTTYGLEGDRLWLEITETVVMDDTDVTMAVLDSVKQLGVRFVVDDFGTGYSSLVYLKRFPVDVLKIDRSFVRGLGSSRDDEAIVRAILRLAEALEHDVVVEGVETAEQLDFVRRLGCRLGQGYYFSRPVPAETFDKMLSPPSILPIVSI